MSSSSPPSSCARWSSSWTGMSCSMAASAMRVGLMISSTPRCRNSSSLRGLLTRAMVRGTSKWCLAIWHTTRLSSSSPVTAATMPARLAPASSRCLPSQPSRLSTMEPTSSAICRARAPVLLQQHQLMARREELLGQVVADLAAAHDDHIHRSVLASRPPRPARAGLVVGARSVPDPHVRPVARAAPGTRPATRPSSTVRQIVARPSAAYASARTGSLILATTIGHREPLGRQLGRQDVAVVALGQGEEPVRSLRRRRAAGRPRRCRRRGPPGPGSPLRGGRTPPS